MSRTKNKVRGADFYPTPAWCVHRLLDVVDLPDGLWLEPAVGDGAIVRAVDAVRGGVDWTTIDIRRQSVAQYRCDFTNPIEQLALDEERFDVIITNPPYNKALDFVIHSLWVGKIVVMLLRLNWLGTKKRQPFLKRCSPDVYVLPNRPSFTGRGTDATEYAWFVWHMDCKRSRGFVQVLDVTKKEELRP